MALLAGRIAVVTGASRGHWPGRGLGLGARRAPMSLRWPARKVASRNSTTRSRQAGGQATLVPADIKDFAAIDRLGAAIIERWKKLDILVGNAGILGKLYAARPCRPKTVGRCDGGQCHRQLAADPLARSACCGLPMRAARCS